jgi:hypothetical protein
MFCYCEQAVKIIEHEIEHETGLFEREKVSFEQTFGKIIQYYDIVWLLQKQKLSIKNPNLQWKVEVCHTVAQRRGADVLFDVKYKNLSKRLSSACWRCWSSRLVKLSISLALL